MRPNRPGTRRRRSRGSNWWSACRASTTSRSTQWNGGNRIVLDSLAAGNEMATNSLARTLAKSRIDADEQRPKLAGPVFDDLLTARVGQGQADAKAEWAIDHPGLTRLRINAEVSPLVSSAARQRSAGVYARQRRHGRTLPGSSSRSLRLEPDRFGLPNDQKPCLLADHDHNFECKYPLTLRPRAPDQGQMTGPPNFALAMIARVQTVVSAEMDQTSTTHKPAKPARARDLRCAHPDAIARARLVRTRSPNTARSREAAVRLPARPGTAEYLYDLVAAYPERASSMLRPSLAHRDREGVWRRRGRSAQHRGGRRADAQRDARARRHRGISELRRGAPSLHRRAGVPLAMNAGDALACSASSRCSPMRRRWGSR